MLAGAFPARRWYRQRRYFGSALWDEAPASSRVDAWTGDASQVARRAAARGHVLRRRRGADAGRASRGRAGAVAVLRSSANPSSPASTRARPTCCASTRCSRDRDAALDRQAAHVRHLEEIAAFRERVVVERDAQLADVNAAREALTVERDALAAARDAAVAERAAALRDLDDALSALASAQQAQAALADEADRLGRAIAAQERIIAYRQSARWWFTMPWLRVRLWWQRLRGG